MPTQAVVLDIPAYYSVPPLSSSASSASSKSSFTPAMVDNHPWEDMGLASKEADAHAAAAATAAAEAVFFGGHEADDSSSNPGPHPSGASSSGPQPLGSLFSSFNPFTFPGQPQGAHQQPQQGQEQPHQHQHQHQQAQQGQQGQQGQDPSWFSVIVDQGGYASGPVDFGQPPQSPQPPHDHLVHPHAQQAQLSALQQSSLFKNFSPSKPFDLPSSADHSAEHSAEESGDDAFHRARGWVAQSFPHEAPPAYGQYSGLQQTAHPHQLQQSAYQYPPASPGASGSGGLGGQQMHPHSAPATPSQKWTHRRKGSNASSGSSSHGGFPPFRPGPNQAAVMSDDGGATSSASASASMGNLVRQQPWSVVAQRSMIPAVGSGGAFSSGPVVGQHPQSSMGPGQQQAQQQQAQPQQQPQQQVQQPQQQVQQQPIPMQRFVSVSDQELNSSSPGDVDSEAIEQDPRVLKRQELLESPGTKMRFKDFFKQFRAKEKESFRSARDFALEYFALLPDKIHWKIHLEMADLAKRENHIKEARTLYQLVVQLQPFASQGWLEYAKMEEECGQLQRCRAILHRGLYNCNLNESLMVKGIKHEERMGNLDAARDLLARLKDVGLDKAWKTILEGALLEARAGNDAVARKIFKYLMHNVPWYGPIYCDALRFEEKCEEYDRAMDIVERGLKEIPRYGPLWFSAFRLAEKFHTLDAVRSTVYRAMNSISKELIWKVYFELAQIEERADNLERARKAYVQSYLHCPSNLRWKVWLGGGRTELNNGNMETARDLLARSLKEVPKKMKAAVLLEWSRLEEYDGDLAKARRILAYARRATRHEWKVFLESALLEMRAGDIDTAIREAQEALTIHTGTGRLWAVLIQLKQCKGEAEQMSVFYEAIREVPKSGEVWCEGARIRMNPHSRFFDLQLARRFLDFAIQFTPQYGDSFIEFMRLELLTSGIEADTTKLEQLCINADPNYGSMWFHCKHDPLAGTRQVLRTAREHLIADLYENHAVYHAAMLDKQLASDARPRSEDDAIPHPDFSTGLTSLNRLYRNVHALPKEMRRKLIFGSDTIAP